MVERIEAWWARRQFTHETPVPYPVGTYREAWAPFPALIRQYHPDLNGGITLTQIPPAADVLVLWECEFGHRFAATPGEQRSRPRGERRRSAWCPDCFAAAKPPRIRPAGSTPPAKKRPRQRLCGRTPDLPPGEPFASECAPRPASVVEAQLRQDLQRMLSTSWGLNAVRLRRPFFDHLEAWPDILIPELRIAVEYDSPGRFGLEHVGRREDADRRKDRAVRSVGWEVVRIRTDRLEKLGPYDLQVGTFGTRAMPRLLDVFREIRGAMFVDAYLA